MATSTIPSERALINSAMTPQIIQLTNGPEYSLLNHVYNADCVKIGRMCILNLDIKFGDVGSRDQAIIYNIPSGSMPKNKSRGALTIWGSNGLSVVISVTGDTVTILYPKSNTEYAGQVIWYTD